MANKQDVEFSLSANVSGVEKIKALREEVLALSKQGGAVGPEFKQLADELDRLGQEAASLDAIRALGEDIQKLSAEQEAAVVSSERLAAAREEAAARAREAAQAEAAAQQRLSEARKGVEDARAAIRSYVISQKELIGGSEKYRQELGALNERLSLNKKAVIDARDALRVSKEVTTDAEKAERSAARAYDNSEKSVKAATNALQQRKETQEESLASLKQLGVEVDNLAAAEANLVDKTNQARLAQQLLTEQSAQWVEELKQQQIIQKTQAELEQRAALERKAILDDYAEAQRRAVAAQIAEEDRLLRLQERTLFEQREAAQRELQFELEAINRVEQERLASAKRQADAQRTLQESFRTTGAVDVQALRDEIGRVNAALATLQQSGNLTGAELQGAMRQANRRVKELELQIREATGALTVMDRVNQAFSTSFGQTFTAFVASNVFMRVIDSVLGIGRAFFDANKQLESFRLALTTVYGSSEIAAKQLGFLRKAANDAGVSVQSISQEFVKFSAAFSGAGIPLEQTNELFARLTKAAGILGLSTDNTARAITALGQIASKGVVSMEELRQQLGDALPGAFQAAARGLNITEKELTKLVESGQLASRDFLPAFSDGLTSISGEVDTLTARLNEGRNVITAFFQQLGDTGIWLALKTAISGVVEVLRGFALVVGSLAIGFENSVKSITVFIAALGQGQGLQGALAAVADQSRASREELTEYAESLGYGADEATKAASAQGSLQRELIATQLAYADNIKIAEKAAVTAGAHTKAVIAEVEAIERSVSAFADDAQQREAAVKAADLRVEALRKEATAEQATLTVITDMIATRERLLEVERAQLALQDLTDKQREQVVADRQKEIDDLRRKADAQAEVAERAKQQAESARVAAEAARVEAQAAKDNADRVVELTAAYEDAAAKLKILNDVKKDGIATDAQIAAAQEEVNKANQLRVDALDDQIDRIKALSESKKADIEATLALNQSRVNELQGIVALGKNIGDENLVRYANVEMMRLQIETIKLKAEAQKIEAEAERQIIAIERQKIEATRELTETERIEFETRRKLVDVKLKQADATLKSTSAIQNEITSTLNGTQTLNSNTQARQESNKTRAEEIKLLKEKAKYDEEGYALNTAGERVNVGMPTWMSIFNDLKGYGLDEDRARAIAGQFTDANGNVPYFNNPGQKAYGAETLSLAVQRAAQKEMMNGGTKKIEPVDAPTQTSAEPAVSTSNQLAPAQNSTITMKFEIGGQSTSIPGLNSTQANALKGVIEQLATLKGTSV